MTKKLKVSDTDKDLTDEDKRKLKLGREYFEIKAIDAYMFGDILMHFASEIYEEARRKKNPFVEIGHRCRIKSGAVIGGDGFNYIKKDDKWTHIENHYRVIIGDDVDIGNCTTIDRGRWRDTTIGDGTKIDNGTQIGSSVIIGKHCKIGAHVIIQCDTEIRDDRTISDGSII